MKRIISFAATLALGSILFSSCMKDEKPYTKPPAPVSEGNFEIQNDKISIGEDYETQVYFSLTTGEVASSKFKAWDIAIANKQDSVELWLNGGKKVLVYATGLQNFAAITNIAAATGDKWRYDDPSGIAGQSGLGLLADHIGEVLLVDDGEGTYFKMQITEITSASYKLNVGTITDVTPGLVELERDENYNFAYYSFIDGVVKPEPPKQDWDLLFTRYRYIYRNYPTEGSDFPYYVNGVLSNPYKTQTWSDSTKLYEFYDVLLSEAETKPLYNDRDKIGFNWKSANANTAQYTVNKKRLFLIKDQNEALWKLRFVNFYDENNVRGTPQFEFQRLK